MMLRGVLCGVFTTLVVVNAADAAPPARAEAIEALRRATAFFHEHVAAHGGYVYAYSGDLKLREGEGTADKDTIWVQPPGTPLVGEAFLDAYEATGDESHLAAARDAGNALVFGQLHSGGWYYRVEFDGQRRAEFRYRRDLDGRQLPDPVSPRDRAMAAGWDDWKRRKYKGNQTILDDDTTQAALRFLMRLDKTLEFKDERLHEAVEFALDSLLNAQYANGAWSANYDRFQESNPDAKTYPPKRASYPDDWPKTWPKDFSGCYVTNDNLMANMIATMLRAWEVYGDESYRASAERAGTFLIMAQMPEPQPAWAQHYNRDMQPVWDRAFEPPAISGRESQYNLDALLLLARKTGDKQFLAPVPAASEYLRRSQLSEGKLSRFYELKTNRPIYFTRDRDGRHVMTYSDERLATNYEFIVQSRLDAIDAEFKRLLSARLPLEDAPREKLTPKLSESAAKIIAALDRRGAWVERGRLRHHKVEPESGVINCQTFADNVRVLCSLMNAQAN